MSVSLALRDILISEGGVEGMFFEWQGVRHFGDWQAEHTALVDDAGLVDLSGASSVIELTGPERAGFLNRLCTNKIDRLPPGAGMENFLTDAKAHVLAYVRLFVRPDSLVLHTVAGQAGKIIAHIDRYLIQEKVELHDRSAQWATFFLSGRGAPEVLSRLIAVPLPDQSVEGVETELAASRVMIRCLEPAAPASYVVLSNTEAAAAVWLTLREAGAQAAGLEAYDALRIEAGWPIYGRDITEDNLPQEVARNARTLSFNKGCYLGQETIARIDSRGHVNRSLVGLKFARAEVPAPGTELFVEGQPAGRVTSAAFSPRLGSVLALGYVRRGYNAPGTRLDSSAGPVEVMSLPVA